MNQTLQIVIAVVGLAAGLGGLIAGIGYVYGKFKEGQNKSKLDAVGLLKADVEALTKKVNELNKQVDDLTEVNKEKDKKLGELLDILHGRDPQTQAVMIDLKKYIEGNTPFIEQVKTEFFPILRRLDQYLNKQSF